MKSRRSDAAKFSAAEAIYTTEKPETKSQDRSKSWQFSCIRVSA